MDINTLYGLLTLLLLVLFIGIVLWAYSGRRKKDFEEAARLPLEDEPTSSSDTDHRENRE